jgi:nitrogenase subunit NifH
VASDRVLIVTEPGIFSVVAADRAMRAIEEIRQAITKRVRPLGILVNRYRPASKEQEFRVNELREMFGPLILDGYLEEKAYLQQSQGAARPIHTWPGEGAALIADFFTDLLATAQRAFEDVSQPEEAQEPKNEKRKFMRRHKRGKVQPEVLDLDTAIEELGEDISGPEVETEQWAKPAWEDNEVAAQKQPEISTNTGNWTFKLEIEDDKKED